MWFDLGFEYGNAGFGGGFCVLGKIAGGGSDSRTPGICDERGAGAEKRSDLGRGRRAESRGRESVCKELTNYPRFDENDIFGSFARDFQDGNLAALEE